MESPVVTVRPAGKISNGVGWYIISKLVSIIPPGIMYWVPASIPVITLIGLQSIGKSLNVSSSFKMTKIFSKAFNTAVFSSSSRGFGRI